MAVCHFCQQRINDNENVCKPCINTHGTATPDGGKSVVTNGKRVVFYESFPTHQMKTFDSTKCINCGIDCGSAICEKCIKENTTESTIGGVKTRTTTINKVFEQTFEDEIVIDGDWFGQ